jgi:predicted extracellular nuclease
VIAVQEIGDNQHLGQSGATTSLGTLQALATRLGALGYGTYTAYVLEGNDNRGIDSGFLVKSTVAVVGGPDQRGGLTASGSCSDVSGRLFDRPPLFLQVDLGLGLGQMWLVSNHFSSKGAPDSCRQAQATWLRGEVLTLETAGNRVIVAGDLNSFETEVALNVLEDGTTTLDNLWSTVPYGEAYSFQFNGLLQTLDHVLVSQSLKVDIANFRYAHLDNDYAQRSAQPDGHKASDHDAPVLTLRAGGPVPVVPETSAPWALVVSGSAIGAGIVLLRMRRRLPASLSIR